MAPQESSDNPPGDTGPHGQRNRAPTTPRPTVAIAGAADARAWPIALTACGLGALALLLAASADFRRAVDVASLLICSVLLVAFGWATVVWERRRALARAVATLPAAAGDTATRSRTEAALAASELRTRQILQTAHDAFVAIDAAGLITDWNPQAEATFGWSRAEVIGCELAETVLPAAHREAHRRGLAHFLATGEGPVLGQRLELPALHRDGHEFPIELTISAAQTEAGYSFNAFLRDITERKRAEAELELARDDALEASRMKSMFVANVSHEIRTPMNGVIGMTELLLDTELDDEQREYGDTIYASSEALLGIIDDILDFSKIEAGKLGLDPTDFDLRETIERACGMLAGRAHAKGLELAVAISPEVPALVSGDDARLRQVIANLVSNAIKFTAEGEVVVRASSPSSPEHPVDSDRARVRITVADTGIGIKPEALARLFTSFSQADGSTTRKYGGTGLGLAISRQLIELMGGELGGESRVGQGSCFWLELTLPRASAAVGSAATELDMAGLPVLVVDDNAINRKILAQQLTAWKMSCQVAESAGRALELLESAAASGTPYVLALLDQNMPDVDGYELALQIRARPALRGMRLLLLTSSVGYSDTVGDGGLDGVLTKPVRQSRLYDAIQAAMTGNRPVARRARRASAPERGPPASGPLVLVVEDNPVNQVVVGRMLEKNGYQAETADNGRAALTALAERPYAAVMMDCQMPELDGYETTREVRRREHGGRRIPIIAMTANSMQGDRERCLAAGMDDYLTKPLRNRTLTDTLTRWITEPETGSSGPSLPVEVAAAGRRPTREFLDDEVIAELEALGGDTLPGLLSLYLKEGAAQAVDLRAAIARGEAPEVAEVAHKLKGGSAAVGAVQVFRVASRLEAAARAGDLTSAADLIDTVERDLEQTRDAFRARIAAPTRSPEQ